MVEADAGRVARTPRAGNLRSGPITDDASTLKAALAIIATLLLGTCSQPPTVLEQIMRAGELRVVTRNLPSAYYLGASGPQGPEFDLASRFAAELGVRLFMYSVPNVADAMRELESHRAHIAAAGLTRGIRLPDSRRASVRRTSRCAST